MLIIEKFICGLRIAFSKKQSQKKYVAAQTFYVYPTIVDVYFLLYLKEFEAQSFVKLRISI
jgi:hypothetical protein